MCQDVLVIFSVVTLAGICNSVGGDVFLHATAVTVPERISVGVKARVVNRKQVDAAASRSLQLSWNVLIAHCTRR